MHYTIIICANKTIRYKPGWWWCYWAEYITRKTNHIYITSWSVYNLVHGLICLLLTSRHNYAVPRRVIFILIFIRWQIWNFCVFRILLLFVSQYQCQTLLDVPGKLAENYAGYVVDLLCGCGCRHFQVEHCV